MSLNSIQEIKAQGNIEGITFIVSDSGVVIFTREYTRHILLMQRASFTKNQIQWGGILNQEGAWMRASYDFGDAPLMSDRELAVLMIKSRL
jgi:hypothetical protein